MAISNENREWCNGVGDSLDRSFHSHNIHFMAYSNREHGMRFSACWPSIYEVKKRTTLTFSTQHIYGVLHTTTRAQIRHSWYGTHSYPANSIGHRLVLKALEQLAHLHRTTERIKQNKERKRRREDGMAKNKNNVNIFGASVTMSVCQIQTSRACALCFNK